VFLTIHVLITFTADAGTVPNTAGAQYSLCFKLHVLFITPELFTLSKMACNDEEA
jgi:hypothetical protein